MRFIWKVSDLIFSCRNKLSIGVVIWWRVVENLACMHFFPIHRVAIASYQSVTKHPLNFHLYNEYAPEDQNITREYYLKVLHHLYDIMHHKDQFYGRQKVGSCMITMHPPTFLAKHNNHSSMSRFPTTSHQIQLQCFIYFHGKK